MTAPVAGIGRRFALLAPERVVADGVCFGDTAVVRSRSSRAVTVYRHAARYLPEAMLKSLHWIDNPDKEPYVCPEWPPGDR